MIAPKLIISYSWSSHQHQDWVLEFATRLRDSGVDVILDKWHLKEGHDAVVFMEQMVSNPEIEKVVIISDRGYKEKADGREGGVGTETQIISKEVYEKQAQDKFVAVARDKNASGKPYLPIYYGSRIYIDLCEQDTYEDNFEQLVRWIFNKPLHIKPELGTAPSYILEPETVSLGTETSYKRGIDALRDKKSYASGAMDEYFEIFSKNLERFRIDRTEEEYDQQLLKNISQFIPYRNQAIDVFITLARYASEEENENISKLHRFFERLIPYQNNPPEITRYRKSDFDNFRFIIHELFLYAVSVLIKFERFDHANYLLQQKYHVPTNADYGRNVMEGFPVFRKHLSSLDDGSVEKLLAERCNSSGIDFRYIMQGDFILYIRASIEGQEWWPETMNYFFDFQSAFEIFSRAASRKYFDKIKCLLAGKNKEALAELLKDRYRQRSQHLGNQSFIVQRYNQINYPALMGLEALATKP